jgi:unsaturated rhamnogalacturonyl hydrolase
MDERSMILPGERAEPTDARLRGTADLLARYPFRPWRYGDSIGFEGLLAAADALNRPHYSGWVHGALKMWAGRPHREFQELDNSAPGHALCLAFENSGDRALIEAAAELAEFLRARPRLAGVFVSWANTPLHPPYGGAGLTAAEAALLAAPGPGVFVDCMHFDPPFFAHLGRLTGNDRLVEMAVEQMLGYINLLRDESGLFWHFFLGRSDDRYGRGWGRGQGWALLGLIDVLEYVPTTHERRPELVATLRGLADALRALQRSDGGWHAVVDDPASGDETSTAPFAAAGFARAMIEGLLDGRFLEPAVRAWQYTLRNLDDGGALGGVSEAVWPCTNQSHYSHLPTGEIVPWGQGPVLVAAKYVMELVSRKVLPPETERGDSQ